MHPGRCSFNDDFNPSTGVHSGLLQSFLAMGLLQIWAASGDFGAGDGRRWSSPTRMVCTMAKDVVVIFVFFRGFCASWSGQLYLHPVLTYLYLFVSVYVFLI